MYHYSIYFCFWLSLVHCAMTDKDFYDRIDKALSFYTSCEAVALYDIRMLEDTWKTFGRSFRSS